MQREHKLRLKEERDRSKLDAKLKSTQVGNSNSTSISTADAAVGADEVEAKAKAKAKAKETPEKTPRDRKFCTLPPRGVDGQVDACWKRVFMEGVDEVGAHCGLFFVGRHYEGLVADVGGRVEGWVRGGVDGGGEGGGGGLLD